MRVLGACAIATALALAAACGSAGLDAFGGSPSAGEDGGAGATAPPPALADGGAADAAIPSQGIVIAHAAAFPAFRLCFSNFPGRAPFPDSTVMPQSNVVGVEVGSVVRVDPLTAPGEVYVVDERQVQARAGASEDRPCSQIVCEAGSSCLRENRDYVHAGTLTQPLGQANVDVLAITGCGNTFFLLDVGASSAQCGPDWDAIAGNLKVRVLPLAATTRDPRSPYLPVQLVHMSQLVEAERGGQTLDVTFGAFDAGAAPLDTSVASGPTLFSPSPQAVLSVPVGDDAIYASSGFRVALRGGASPSVVVDTSLAEVQALSSPRDVPSHYYHAASNYALLLLGDPSRSAALPDGGANPAYDPRRGVHLLAVPVASPQDAGQAAGEAGTSTGDGG
jgi:hypothetical protein